MVATPDSIKQLVKALPAYKRMRSGDTFNQCQEFSEQVLEVLLANGVDAIMVQARHEPKKRYHRDEEVDERMHGEPVHHFILCKVKEGNDMETVVVDPTVSQFHSKIKGVFVGTMEELREKVVGNHENKQRIFDQYWPSRLFLFEPPQVYEHTGAPLPSREERFEFQSKWGAQGVVQKEEHVATTRRAGDLSLY